MKKTGFNETKALLGRITPEIEAQFEKANRENAEMIVDLAKVLIPEKSGASRAAIRNLPGPDGSQLIDFGQKAKVIEGNRGPRPFVNPAIQATKKKRTARARKALRDAIKAVK
ncbi:MULTISPECIES: hypothetical protein [unclassified Sulfitobacter]|jgi:hypothetical protein|uniref:hypothetical protein n=1 Tax=unclassified Sulfitobacter TaxID=196795 RepID=UPI0007C22668|nr:MULTISPECIES: hypothetical protein [unclassified Sulfitobacter]KZY05268.1 hypothetical protein A3721_15165 [Sulfitobacter sp. HI0023]KZY26836.1 hypothetical protein A3728_14800 [Sulfitobacter sp. HI0040]KZZ62437.1 hypothetical protein A3764_06265 [Sulfitobacter sp. HI0129]